MGRTKILASKGAQAKVACGYVRCSTDEQGATSIPQQRREIEKWAAGNGYEIADWFVDEGVSGTRFDKRPGFLRMKEEIEGGSPKFNIVLVYDESRWGRAIDLRQAGYWKMHFAMKGVSVRLVHTSSQQGNNLQSFVVEMVESAEASEYSRKLSRTIRRGMTSKEQGIYSRGGTAPYGYKRVAVDVVTGTRRELEDGMRSSPGREKVVWALGDALEVATVKRIFELKAKGVGYYTIADTLNIEKIPPPRRGRWKNTNTKWSRATIFGLLKNQGYTGDRVYNRLTFSPYLAEELNLPLDGGKRVNDQSVWVVHQEAHTGIVSRELFEEANKDRVREECRTIGGEHINQHFHRSTYLLTSLIRCSKCGFAFQGSTHTKTGKTYYIDGGRKNKGSTVCRWFSIPQKELEDFVVEGVKQVLLAPPIQTAIEQELRNILDDQPETLREQLGLAQLRWEHNEKRRRSLLEAVESGAGSTTILDRLKELEAEAVDIKAEIDRLELEINKSTVEKNGKRLKAREVSEMVKAFFSNFQERFENAPLVEKKELIRMVVEKIEVDPESRTATTQYRRVPSGILEGEGISLANSQKDCLLPVALTGIEPVF